MMTIYTPWLTDLPGVTTEYAEWATLNPEEARNHLRWCVSRGLAGIAWRYYYPPQPAEVADRVRKTRERQASGRQA